MCAKRYLAPVLLGFTLSAALPLAALVSLSGFDWNLIEPPTWVAFDNFANLSGLANSLAVTACIAGMAVTIQLAAGLAIGYLLAGWGKAAKNLAAVFLLPWLSAPIALGVLWQWILAPSGGLLSNLLGFRVDLLANSTFAPIVIAVLSAWIGTGYTAMLIASGLRAIPRNTIDAARVDGANAFALLWKIQLPQIHKLLFFLVATLTLQSLAILDLVVVLTGGGPSKSTEVVSLLLVDAALKTFEVGGASAMSIVFMLFSALVLAVEYALYRFVVRNFRD